MPSSPAVICGRSTAAFRVPLARHPTQSAIATPSWRPICQGAQRAGSNAQIAASPLRSRPCCSPSRPRSPVGRRGGSQSPSRPRVSPPPRSPIAPRNGGSPNVRVASPIRTRTPSRSDTSPTRMRTPARSPASSSRIAVSSPQHRADDSVDAAQTQSALLAIEVRHGQRQRQPPKSRQAGSLQAPTTGAVSGGGASSSVHFPSPDKRVTRSVSSESISSAAGVRRCASAEHLSTSMVRIETRQVRANRQVEYHADGSAADPIQRMFSGDGIPGGSLRVPRADHTSVVTTRGMRRAPGAASASCLIAPVACGPAVPLRAPPIAAVAGPPRRAPARARPGSKYLDRARSRNESANRAPFAHATSFMPCAPSPQPPERHDFGDIAHALRSAADEAFSEITHGLHAETLSDVVCAQLDTDPAGSIDRSNSPSCHDPHNTNLIDSVASPMTSTATDSAFTWPDLHDRPSASMAPPAIVQDIGFSSSSMPQAAERHELVMPLCDSARTNMTSTTAPPTARPLMSPKSSGRPLPSPKRLGRISTGTNMSNTTAPPTARPMPSPKRISTGILPLCTGCSSTSAAAQSAVADAALQSAVALLEAVAVAGPTISEVGAANRSELILTTVSELPVVDVEAVASAAPTASDPDAAARFEPISETVSELRHFDVEAPTAAAPGTAAPNQPAGTELTSTLEMLRKVAPFVREQIADLELEGPLLRGNTSRFESSYSASPQVYTSMPDGSTPSRSSSEEPSVREAYYEAYYSAASQVYTSMPDGSTPSTSSSAPILSLDLCFARDTYASEAPRANTRQAVSHCRGVQLKKEMTDVGSATVSVVDVNGTRLGTFGDECISFELRCKDPRHIQRWLEGIETKMLPGLLTLLADEVAKRSEGKGCATWRHVDWNPKNRISMIAAHGELRDQLLNLIEVRNALAG